jgi:hypothetical protein
MQLKSVRSLACATFVGLAALTLTGCGGGGGGGGSTGGGAVVVTPTPTPTATGPIYTQGVFAPASTFANLCAAPRSGADIQGNAFPDKAGSLLQELFFLRSWTNETYLWNTEVVDQNPASFTDRLTYFGVLKTNATTPSGKAKDQFHFNQLTSDYLASTISAPSAGYGAEIRVFAGTPPRNVQVTYTSPNTPATELLAGTPKLARGAKLLVADSIDVVNGGSTQAQVDILNNATFPKTAGETHTFTVQYADGSTRAITLLSGSLVEPPVNRQAVLTTATGKVGYILLNTFSPFSSEKALVDTIASLKTQGVGDLVLDLRYNGGGLLAVASQLGYMVAGPTRTAGRIFEKLQFNAAAGSLNPVTGGANNPTPFYSTGLGFTVANGAAIQSLDLPRVYIITTSRTCSASEAVINGLRGVNVNVVLIGGTTCGKPYGFYPQDNCGQTYFSVQFKGVNDAAFGDYADGFAAANSIATSPVKIPGCAVNDDLTRDLGDASEAMLAAALNYRATGACPTPPTATGLGTASATRAGVAMEETGRSPAAELLRNNRDMRMPQQSVAPR